MHDFTRRGRMRACQARSVLGCIIWIDQSSYKIKITSCGSGCRECFLRHTEHMIILQIAGPINTLNYHVLLPRSPAPSKGQYCTSQLARKSSTKRCLVARIWTNWISTGRKSDVWLSTLHPGFDLYEKINSLRPNPRAHAKSTVFSQPHEARPRVAVGYTPRKRGRRTGRVITPSTSRVTVHYSIHTTSSHSPHRPKLSSPLLSSSPMSRPSPRRPLTLISISQNRIHER